MQSGNALHQVRRGVVSVVARHVSYPQSTFSQGGWVHVRLLLQQGYFLQTQRRVSSGYTSPEPG